MNVRRSGGIASLDTLSADVLPVEERGVLNEEAFHRMISLERKRTERSRKPFLLMLLDMGNGLRSDKNGKALDKILSALSLSTRETDVTGWYKNNSVVGVMFTEFGAEDRNSILSTMMTRVSETLRNNLSSQQFGLISISFHLFPEEWNHDIPQRPSNPTLYPDLASRDNAKKVLLRDQANHGYRSAAPLPCCFSHPFSWHCYCHQADIEGPGVLPAEASWAIR